MENWIKTLLESSAMVTEHWKNTAGQLAEQLEQVKQEFDEYKASKGKKEK